MLDIMMLDDQRSHLNKWTDVILQDKKAAAFIQGIGIHWYASVEDAFPHFDQMDDVNQKYPDKYILATEGNIIEIFFFLQNTSLIIIIKPTLLYFVFSILI